MSICSLYFHLRMLKLKEVLTFYLAESPKNLNLLQTAFFNTKIFFYHVTNVQSISIPNPNTKLYYFRHKSCITHLFNACWKSISCYTVIYPLSDGSEVAVCLEVKHISMCNRRYSIFDKVIVVSTIYYTWNRYSPISFQLAARAHCHADDFYSR